MKTLVFLHGWGVAGSIWRRQAEAFSGPGVTVLTPTFPTWDPSWLAGRLKELPLAETVLVGWSLGGMLLLEVLGQESVSPGGLVLVATAASFCRRPDHPWGQPRTVVRALRQTVRRNLRAGLADFAGRCLAAREENFRQEIFQEFRPRQGGADLVAGLNYLLDADLRPHLSRVPAAAMIIQGDQDAIVPPAQAEVLGQYLQNARVVKMPGAGHAPFLTQSEEFNRILERFLRQGAPRRDLRRPGFRGKGRERQA